MQRRLVLSEPMRRVSTISQHLLLHRNLAVMTFSTTTTTSGGFFSSSTRKESDSLGGVDVPLDALYGAQTVRAMENYPISGRTAHPSLIRSYLRLKSAAAKANGKLRALGPSNDEVARLIGNAVEELMTPSFVSAWPRIFPVDPYQAGAGTSQNMNVNEVVANVANRAAGKPLGSYSPVHPNDHVNRSQSSNDSFPTVMRLAVLEVSGGFSSALSNLATAFREKGAAWKHVPKSARTHLQDAVPITLGQEFEAYAVILSQCARLVEDSRQHLRELGIGGGAAGTGLTVPFGFGELVVEELRGTTGDRGLRLAPDLCAATQSQLPVAIYSSALRLTAIELTRICNDLRLMASGPMTGLAEIILPSVQPGSSIMPGKVNPSILEMANQTWYSVMGYDHTISACTQAGQLDLNVMMPMMAYSALEATKVATNAVEILRTRCVEGIEPNHRRLRTYFETTPQVATALSPLLGYGPTAVLVKEALATERSVIDLVRERKLVSEEKLKELLDVKMLTGVRE